MKATLTPEVISALAAKPNDAELGNFVITARTLTAPAEAATELLHERLKVNGYVDAGNGTRITTKTRRGKYKIVNAKGAWDGVKSLLPEERMAKVVSYSKDRLIDEVAEARNCPKGGKAAVTATSLFETTVAPHMQQDDVVMLVFSA